MGRALNAGLAGQLQQMLDAKPAAEAKAAAAAKVNGLADPQQGSGCVGQPERPRDALLRALCDVVGVDPNRVR